MVSVSLKQFVETGRFGSVCLGMSRAQVENILGTPDDVGGASRKYRKPPIWKYGDVEFHFGVGADTLWLVHLDDFDVPSGGKSINLDPWIFSNSLTISETENQFSHSGLAFEVKEWEHEDNAKCLMAGVGVKLRFSGRDARLCAMSYSNQAAI